MSNRLAKETSPYLLQHAHNPVDWYPWGAEAIERARREDRPILLSIGYSACHWCHVMERESFEDAETARLMNERFVNVKVDREERPDVDAIYMQAVQAMTGHGGWPMTMFLTPALEPFWGGTYFPPDDRPGMPSFRRVLQAVSEAYRDRREDVARVAQSMRDMYAAVSVPSGGRGALTADSLERAARALLAQYDARFGGFGGAPKFPQAMAMEFLLQHAARTNNAAALAAVQRTFQLMARGGIYDQVGGGFARYAVDAQWLVPHFEKMLYDNALLVRLGVHLWQATADTEVRGVVAETLAWVEREMTAPSGGFYSSLDADSEGHEGRFYVWDDAELREVLGADAGAMASYWGVTPAGNFEGANILSVVGDPRSAEPALVASAKQRLRAVRARRVRPARDEKILASWNGLMLRAVAEAARVFDDARWRAAAVRSAEAVFRDLVRGDRVFRTHRDGSPRIPGFLEDYAALALGALATYEATFDRLWLDRSVALSRAMLRLFRDDATGAFYDVPADAEALITRPRDVTDNAIPSGTSLAVELLLRLGDLLGDAELMRGGTAVLETLAGLIAQYPLAFGHALTAADLAVHGAVEIAVLGDPAGDDFRRLAAAASEPYVPSVVLAGGGPGGSDDVALLRDRRPVDGRAAAYVCHHATCTLALSDAGALRDAVRGAAAAR